MKDRKEFVLVGSFVTGYILTVISAAGGWIGTTILGGAMTLGPALYWYLNQRD